MDGKITYHQQVSFCGKPRCRKCNEGTGHGPYWYAYQTVNGHTTRRYIGKNLPVEIQKALEKTTVNGQTAIPRSPSASTPSAQGSSLRIYMLGQYNIERQHEQQWQPIDDETWQEQTKVRALLALLICSPGRAISREQALEALWPRTDTDKATQLLDKTFHSLLTVLQSAHAGSSSWLRQEDDRLLLVGQEQVWVDVDAFEEILLHYDALAQQDPSEQREALLRQAMGLYNGDFLPEGRQIKWVMQRRVVLRQQRVRLLLALTDLYIKRQAYAQALETLDRLLIIDANNEAAVQRLMIVLAFQNRRGEALQAYKRLITPSAQSQVLQDAIRQGTLHDNSILALIMAPQKLARPLSSVTTTVQTESEGTQGVQIGRVHQNPLVGREHEQAILRQMLFEVEQAQQLQVVGMRRASGIPLDTQRRSQCMIMMGDTGIGKTRLAEEMSREAQRMGWAVVWGRAYKQESGIPYRLWTEVLRKVMNLGTLPPLSASTHSSSLSRIPLQEMLQPLVDLLPELEETLSEVRTRNDSGSSGILPLQSEQKQLRLWEALRDILIAASEATPLLIVLDDIQWADDNSDKLLAYLARNLHGYPVVLLCTCRDSEVPRHSSHHLRVIIDQMLREHSVSTLDINPLTSEQIARLVAHLPADMVEHIKEYAAGNPFFAEELARTAPPTIPKSISAALEQRMSKLSPDCRQLLDTAAVLSGSFEFSLIYAMEAAGRDEESFDDDTVFSLLEEAIAAGVISEEGMGTRIIYQFWHPLLVSHLYDTLSALRKARLHRRAADVLRRMHKGREDEVAATIVHHLMKADADPALIAHYAELAGDRAYQLSAANEQTYTKSSALKSQTYTEAERYYRRALYYLQLVSHCVVVQINITDSGDATLSPAIPLSPCAQQLTPEQQERFIYLIERLAECTMIQGSFEQARALYASVLELRKLRRHDGFDAASQYEAQVQALLWAEIGWTWRYAGDVPLARSYLEQGEQALRAAGVTAGPAWARLRHQQGSLYMLEGRYEEARQAMQEALSLFEQQRQPDAPRTQTRSARSTRIQRTVEGNPVDLGQTHKLLAALADAVGSLREAFDHLDTALAIFEQYDHKRRIAHVSCDIGHIQLKRAQFEQAQAALRRSLNLAEQLGDEPLMGVVYWNLAELAANTDEGDLAEAEHYYKTAISLQERINDREYLSKWNAGLAAVLLERGHLEEAKTCAIRALQIGRSMDNNKPCIGSALVALGKVRIALAGQEEISEQERARHLRLAMKDLRRALALSGLDADTRMRGRLFLGQLLLLKGQRKKAREEIQSLIAHTRKAEHALIERQAQKMLELC